MGRNRGIEDGGSGSLENVSGLARSGARTERERLLSGLADLSGIELFAFDRGGRLSCMNSQLLGGGAKPDAGLWDVFPGPVAEILLSAAGEVFSSGRPGLLEIEAMNGNKTVFFENEMAPFLDDKGEVSLVMVACRDVSAFKRPKGVEISSEAVSSKTAGLIVVSCAWLSSPGAPRLHGESSRVPRDYASELKECQLERDAISEGLDGLIIERIGPDFKLVWGNGELRKFCGRPVADMEGRPCYEAFYNKDAPCDGCSAADAIKRQTPQTAEFQTANGRSFKSKGVPLKNEDGSLKGVVHVALDITEWRNLDERMRQAKAKAEELAKVKSEFLSCISHEIRTPLNAIVGMSELLKDAVRPDSSSEVLDYCDEIERASDMLMTIINDILDYSLLEAGSIKVFAQTFDLREEINSAAGLMARRAAQKGLLFQLDIEESLPWSVCGDPRHLRRIMNNLIGNAIKFTDSGSVLVKVSKSPKIEGGYGVRISVRDTGVGIASDSLERIFEPFTQEDSSSKRSYGGTGLGLAIVRKLLGVLGGGVEVQSAKGVGSVFSADIPFEDPLKSGGRSEARLDGSLKSHLSSGAFRGVKALILDDGSSAPLMRRILETLGVEPALAEDLEAAELRLAEGGCDIVFFDASLAGSGGLGSLVANLRRASLRKDIPLIALSPSASGRGGDAAEKSYCQGAGISRLLSKPPRRSQIAKALRDCCRNSL